SPSENLYVLIGKNYGRQVGGSLVHGHQQIAISSLIPQQVKHQTDFIKAHGCTFSQFMMEQNPRYLTVRSYGTAELIVPYFLPRPYQMMLLVKDSQKEYIHQLNRDEINDICQGWQDAIRLMRQVLPQIGRDVSYNITTHNGKGAGLYFEFLPFTQEMGCFERMGLFVCQSTAETAANKLKEEINHLDKIDLL
ncbi:MAG: hypothetical protein LWX83_17780, partial [Anaerolineae bacterium]|nr:hypothetical protein [Anaerolineae bacterium]